MSKRNILIINEGYEEEDYFNRLISLNIFNSKYNLITKNAKGSGNIAARFQNEYSKAIYDLILIFCDADKEAKTYLKIKDEIDNMIFSQNVSHNFIIFSNPTTLEIILSHFDKVSLTSQSKITNQDIIFKLTGINKYKATNEQRKILFNKIHRKSYYIMKDNIKELSTDYRNTPSTNALVFFNNLESSDTRWIENINKFIL